MQVFRVRIFKNFLQITISLCYRVTIQTLVSGNGTCFKLSYFFFFNGCIYCRAKRLCAYQIFYNNFLIKYSYSSA